MEALADGGLPGLKKSPCLHSHRLSADVLNNAVYMLHRLLNQPIVICCFVDVGIYILLLKKEASQRAGRAYIRDTAVHRLCSFILLTRLGKAAHTGT